MNMKILLIGNSGSGKSCLLLRFSDNKFNTSFHTTIGVDFKVKFIEADGQVLKLVLWDTAGQQRFKTLTSSYYRGADGIIIVYDITDRQSFDNVIMWYDEMNKSINKRVSTMLIGNKCDLTEKRAVSEQQGRSLANKYGIPFAQTSAKTSENVNQIFANLAKNMVANNEGK